MCRSAYFVNQISHRQIKDRQDNCIGREAQAPGLWGGVDAADLPMKLMVGKSALVSTIEKRGSIASIGVGIEPMTTDLEVRHLNHQATMSLSPYITKNVIPSNLLDLMLVLDLIVTEYYLN